MYLKPPLVVVFVLLVDIVWVLFTVEKLLPKYGFLVTATIVIPGFIELDIDGDWLIHDSGSKIENVLSFLNISTGHETLSLT